MIKELGMYNVVWYDGVEAYVNKYILRKSTAKKDIDNFFLQYDGIVVHLDELYDINKDNVYAYMTGDKEQKYIFEHFLEMYAF